MNNFGILDEEFIRGKVPMTKREIRILTLTEARINENSIVYDIGAGTGSLSIEAAFVAKKIYAIEKNPIAIDLIKQNIKKFGVENIEVLEKIAPDGMENLPFADAILIGGSGKKILQILDKSFEKLKPNGRVIINTITIENLNTILSYLREKNLKYYANEITLTRFLKTTNYHLKKSENPVSIIVAEKEHSQTIWV